MKYLDFNAISQAIPFVDLLNHLNIPYTEKGGTVKTDKIIVTVKKNMFFYKGTQKGGSVINFYSDYADCDLRTAATYLKKTFLTAQHAPKREIPTLTLKYDKWMQENGISEELATSWEIGRVNGRSVLSGCIAFRVYFEDNTPAGYVGWNLKKKAWVFPKGSKRGNLVYNLNRVRTEYAILVSDILDCLHLINQGFPFTVAMMAESATSEQINLLGNMFKRILLIHKSPDNIAQRLSQYCFCKAVQSNSVRELDRESVKSFF